MKFRNAVFASVVLWAALPAFADEVASGPNIQLNADLFALRFDPEFGDGEFTGYGGAARVNIAFSERWNAQLDVRSQTIGLGEFNANDTGQFLHLYLRDPTSHAIGIYGGFGSFVTPFFAIDQATIGAEAQRYLGPLTLYGQGGYSHLASGDTSADLFMGRVQARLFITDNAFIAGDLMWAHLDTHAEFVADFQTAAATAMVRLPNSPAAIFGSIRYDLIAPVGAVQSSSWTASAGLRVMLDRSGSTLKSSSRTGPAMDLIPIQYLGLLGGG